MKKKFIALTLLILLCGFLLTGCFGMGGSMFGAPDPTMPPQSEFTGFDDFQAAVAKAKAGDGETDITNLQGLEYYYVPKALPEGAQISYIKVAKEAVRVGYTFGPLVDERYDNQMEFTWYRTANINSYLSDRAQKLGTYDSFKIEGIDYLHTIPTLQFIVTPEPGSTAEAQPTPRAGEYCQFVYWVQGDAALTSAVPLGFTNEDIGRYCNAEKVELK